MQMLFDSRLLRARTLRVRGGHRLHIVLHRVRGRMPQAAVVMPAVPDPPHASPAPHAPRASQAASPAAAPVTEAVVVSPARRTWRTTLEEALSQLGRRISRLWQRLDDARRARHLPASPRS